MCAAVEFGVPEDEGQPNLYAGVCMVSGQVEAAELRCRETPLGVGWVSL